MITTTLLDTMTDAEIARHMFRFRERLASGELGRMQIPVCTIKRLDSTGDTELLYPRVDISRLPELPLDAQVAVAVAERTIAAAQASRQRMVATSPGSGRSIPVEDFDIAEAPDTIVILNPITGG